MKNVADKILLITGASSGLAAETARHLVKEGAKVALGARRKDRLDALVAELGTDNASAFQVDVTDREQIEAFVKNAHGRWGRTTILSPGAVDTELPQSVRPLCWITRLPGHFLSSCR